MDTGFYAISTEVEERVIQPARARLDGLVYGVHTENRKFVLSFSRVRVSLSQFFA